MASSNQNQPALAGHGEEASNANHDPATQQTSGPTQGDNVNISPSIPQPAASAHPQVLPQPFYGQQQYAYAPYSGQPGQPLPYGTPVRPLPQQSTAYVATRLGLTALSLIWSIVIIALTSALLGDASGASNLGWYSYPVSIISILWNAAELITYFVRKRKQVPRGIHPGAHVGLHLIFWLAGAFSILLTTTVLAALTFNVRDCQDQDENPDAYSYYGSYCDEIKPYDHYTSTVLPAVRGLLAIFALWTITHFVLFVLACIDTHKRNAMRPAGFVVPVPVPAQGMYYPQQVVGAQQVQQPMQYYPYPAVMQPQPAASTGASNEKQPAQPAQNLGGFYAPVASSSAQAP